MHETLPIVLVPGLLCSARLYAHKSHRLAKRPGNGIESRAQDRNDCLPLPPASSPRAAALCARWAVHGRLRYRLRRGAAGRRSALESSLCSDTLARPETFATNRAARLEQIALAGKAGRLAEVAELLFPLVRHRDRHAATKTL